MKAKNIQGNNLDEIRHKLTDAVSDGFKPTLAIAFCSISQDRKGIASLLNSYGIDVFGNTTAGEIIDTDIAEQSAVIMLLDMAKDTYRLYTRESEGSSTFGISEDTAKYAKACFANPAIILVSSGLTIDAEQIIAGVQTQFSGNIPLFGGLAGDDLTMKASYVFSTDFDTSNGIIALIIDRDKINVQGIATSGWDNIGLEKTITKSDGNVVFTIDDEPAVNVFVKFFQFTESVDNKSEIIATNFAQYPLQLKKDDGQLVLRAPLMVDIESRALIFAGGIPQGAKVKFSVPPGFDLVEKTANEISKIRPEIPNADALILFSCKARHLALGPMTGDEAENIRNIWNVPLLGCFTYGEIGSTAGNHCEFHNETCSLVVLGEK